MLTVKTYLDRSTIHGIGLFAGQDIEAGQQVWAFHPEVDRSYELEQWLALEKEIAPAAFGQMRKLSYKEGNRIIICIDNAQFMNHSTSDCNVHDIPGGVAMTANRAIKAGEELLCNYEQFCDLDDWSLEQIRRLS